MKIMVLVVSFAVLAPPVASGQKPGGVGGDKQTPGMRLFLPTEVAWKEGPESLPKGTKVAVLEGDPSQPGLFTMRLWFPDGFEVPPHWHTQVEHVSVISGTLHIGMGEKFDRAATRAMPAGSFGYWPAQMKHYGWAQGDTILQLYGAGPWAITYVNAADDPRHKGR